MNKFLALFVLLCLLPVAGNAKSPAKAFSAPIETVFQDLRAASAPAGTLLPQPAKASSTTDPELRRRLRLGEKLLENLIEQERAYFSLDYDDWLAASDYLLGLDTAISKRAAEGNYVIKFQIVEMLLVSTREWVLKTDSKERLNGILSLLQRAKYHMPSRALGVQLWLKENGQVTALTYPMSESDVTRAHYKAAADQMLRTVQEYYEEDEVRRLFGEAIESHARAGDLLSLYLIERSGYYFMGKPATYAHIWMVLKTATLLKLTHGDVLGNWHPASSDWFEKLLGDEPWAEYVPIDSFSIRHLSELTIRFKGRECKRRGLCE